MGQQNFNEADTYYEFSSIDTYKINGALYFSDSERKKNTLWDSGGVDTLEFLKAEF